jgi:cytosol alanyl aminopeptidase
MNTRSRQRRVPLGCLTLFLLLAAGPAATATPATSAAPGGTAPDGADLRLGRAVVPTFESAHLRLDADRPDYSGSVRVELDVRERTSSFRFHAERMELGRVELRPAGGGPAVPLQHERGPIGLLTVTAPAPLEPGAYVLEIDFTNTFGTQAVGLYRMVAEDRSSGAKQGYLFTQMEPDDAREAFPLWDEPNFKIPYQLSLTVPEGHTAVTNTPVENETVQNGQRTLVFQKSKPMPSYLLAIAAGPLESVPIAGLSVPGRIYTVRGQSHLTQMAVEMTPPLLAALEGYFGSPYPYEKLDYIAIPEYWPGAMENPGAITFSDRVLLLQPQTASMGERRWLAHVIAHELAHMWFGDLVTMQWWDDLWLNESFADWLGAKIADQLYPQYRIDNETLGAAQYAMTGDARPSAQAIRRVVLPTDNLMENVGVQYNKGKVVLAMFERWLGAERFRAGVLDYLQKHAWGNATAADLWAALSRAADGAPISEAMSTFIEQPGLPLVGVEPLGGGKLRLTQRRFLPHGVEAPALLWKVPVVLSFGAGERAETRSVLLEGAAQELDLGFEPDWVLPNAEARGYYRWSVTPAMLRRLAEDAQRLLSVRERIGLVGNLSALLDAGLLAGDEYLRLLAGLSLDADPEVLGAVLGGLAHVKTAFTPPELEQPFARFVRATLAPALARIGLEKRPGEVESVSLVREALLYWLGKTGRDPRVLEHARELARAYLADPASVDPALAGTALALAALGGERALFDKYRARFEAAAEPGSRGRFLGGLGAFRDPALVEEALRYALSGPLRPQEIGAIPRQLTDTAAGRDRAWRWMTENHAEISKRIPEFGRGFLPYYASGCEAERVEAAREFFGKPEHRAPGTETTLAKVADQVGDCVRLREREGEAVRRYLEQPLEAAPAAPGGP